MTGRRSPLPRWLAAIGARPPGDELDDCGFIAAAGLDDPWEFACSFHHATAEIIEPWYRDTLAADRHRLAEIDALIGGGNLRPRDPGWGIGQALANAAFKDPDCLRGFASVAMVLSRAADVVVRPGLLDKVIALGSGWRDEPLPAPSRAGLLSIVAAGRCGGGLMRVETGEAGIVYDVTGDGPPVILLHGFPDSGRLWRNQVPVLADAGFRVIVPDLRGYGRSPPP